MSPKDKSTKQHILTVASELFANKGFSGTSVREIASQAEVNLSAINYHFENKENLYLEVFVHNHNWIEENINALGEDKGLNIVDFAEVVFDFFINNGHPLLNTFKIFVNDEVTIPLETIHKNKDHMGPPGQVAIYEKIQAALGDENVSDEAINWAVRMIFSNIVHHGVCFNTSTMKEKSKVHPEFELNNIKKSIRIHAHSLVDYLKRNKDNWSDV